jgi:hypothetical protein
LKRVEALAAENAAGASQNAASTLFKHFFGGTAMWVH